MPRRIKYPEGFHEFVLANYKGISTRALCDLANETFGTDFSDSLIKSYKSRHKLVSGASKGIQKGESRLYPPEMENYVRKNIQGKMLKDFLCEVNEHFGTSYTLGQLTGFVKNRKISSGYDARFKKGRENPHKGDSSFRIPNSEKSRFKKGHTPLNHKPIGSERIDVGDGYTLIKTEEPNVWRLKHQVIWEEAYGCVPEGMVITFLDGDKSNICLENLQMISMAESIALTRAGLRDSDPDVTKTGILVARLDVLARKKEREMNGKPTNKRRNQTKTGNTED